MSRVAFALCFSVLLVSLSFSLSLALSPSPLPSSFPFFKFPTVVLFLFLYLSIRTAAQDELLGGQLFWLIFLATFFDLFCLRMMIRCRSPPLFRSLSLFSILCLSFSASYLLSPPLFLFLFLSFLSISISLSLVSFPASDFSISGTSLQKVVRGGDKKRKRERNVDSTKI